MPWEAKMIDIIKDDVQTYVRELIAKEFESNNNEEKVFSDSQASRARANVDECENNLKFGG
jgi:hypothetical protein